MDTASPVRRGRGVSGNVPNRFDPYATEPFDDGWGSVEEERLRPPAVATTLTPERARSALSWNDSPDLGFDRSLNPYRGCEHGCCYCYARPSHAFVGLSPGLDFETRLFFKPDMAAILARELSRPGYAPRPVALGANTDPYQPAERRLGITRALLEVLERFGHPLTIVTKGAGIARDLDLLRRLAERDLVRVWISVTTLDSALARGMEPRAATPARRLDAIRVLNAGGVPAGALLAPMIPGLNDAELERILEAGVAAGATHAGWGLLRLPGELRGLFTEWLRQHQPERARHVLSLIREVRGGDLNDSRFGQRFSGQGPYAAMIGQRFRVAAKRLGVPERLAPLALHHFAVPDFAVPDDARSSARSDGQMTLF
ncbi:PA0069 family radical SAM protein [Rhizosaccharibacter radicis]|uniref:PA0069 family radical SAM protein n=1 Tax=Rhizosaccharibacter radicis TaxID=2782605 RepID=A0ABT1VTU1_9PROT|nr:PA0069 family radical SAM protein [Acetobacteraceae bacterium KSS12]